MANALLFEFLLRLGDTALILGQRLGEWTGQGPALEEDMALTNVALDLVGQASLWYSYAGEVEGKGRDEDQLAFLRDAPQFRNLLLVEQSNGDFAQTIVRQFLFDSWHCLLLEALRHAVDPRVAEISGKALKEATYHLRRSTDWVIRLGDGTAESHRRMQAGLDRLWRYTGEMFVADAVDAESGVDIALLSEPWLSHVRSVIAQATLAVPESGWMPGGGKSGTHTEHLSHLLAEMQVLQRTFPGARW